VNRIQVMIATFWLNKVQNKKLIWKQEIQMF